ncbi:MAG TPA: acyltransferase, partial [Rhizomicrobium sp.]|nr:acyltransferase [Rhizomicrobium sp.]
MEFLLARFNAQAQRRAQEVPQTASPSDVRASSLGGVAHLDYRPDIDGLRAIAVLSVVAFHAFPAVVRGGFVGVDVFFVISGYLISGILFTSLERKRFSFLQFYARRIRRIFPALALVLFACLAAGWFLLFSNEYARLGKHVAGSAGFVANLVLWNESGYFDKAAATKPLLHIWSLGIEEQFYFVWPFLLYIIWKRRFWTPVVLAGIFIATFWINIYTAGSGNTAADYYSPLTRFWELAAGALLAYFSLYKIAPNPLITKLPAPAARVFAAAAAPDPFINNLKAMAGLIAVLLAVFLVDEAGGYPGWWALLPVGGTYLMLSAGPKAWLNKRILANRLMVAVGLISYPLYLWHWPLLSFMRIVDGKAPAAPAAALAILLSVVLAWGTYILIEKPIRWGGSGAIKALFLIAVMGVMADAGYYVYISKGVPSRNPAAEDLMAAQKDIDIGETRVVAGLQERAGTYHGLDGAMMIGTPGTDETLLIGDSTMYQYIPRVRQYAEQHRAQMEHNLFVVVGLGACLTLPDITNPASPACAEFMDKAIAAAHLPSVKTVGFAALW